MELWFILVGFFMMVVGSVVIYSSLMNVSYARDVQSIYLGDLTSGFEELSIVMGFLGFLMILGGIATFIYGIDPSIF